MYRILFYLLFLALLLAPAGTASAALPDGWFSQDIFRASDGNPPAGTGADQAVSVWTVIPSAPS